MHDHNLSTTDIPAMIAAVFAGLHRFGDTPPAARLIGILMLACGVYVLMDGGHSATGTRAATHGQERKVEVVLCGEHRFTIPEPDHVSGIVVDLHNSASGLPNVEGFLLPPEYHAEILAYFNDIRVATEVHLDACESGSLRIKIKPRLRLGTCREERVCWYWRGQGKLQFSVCGVRCTTSTYPEWAKGREEFVSVAGGLNRRLREIYQECTGKDVLSVPLPDGHNDGEETP